MVETRRKGWLVSHAAILPVVGLAFLLTGSGRADEDSSNETADAAARSGDSDRGARDDSNRRRGDYHGDPIDTGFLFIDGIYLPPPYVVTREGDEILINGEVIERARPEESPQQERRGGRRSSPRGRSRFQYSVLEIEELLESDGTVVAFDGQPALLVVQQLGVDFLDTLVLNPDRNHRRDELAGLVAEGADAEAWDEFARSFTPSTELVQRVEAIKSRIDHAESANFAQIAAVRRSEFLLYPLTVLGLVVSVLSLGHLLLSRPPALLSWREVDASQNVTRMVVQCTLFVVALSLLDLVYTVLALQANQMRELNPLGSQLIHDPLLLAVFKGLATIVGVSILVVLRRYRGAQMASWWVCLICTVVTFRWLTFNSLFMT